PPGRLQLRVARRPGVFALHRPVTVTPSHQLYARLFNSMWIIKRAALAFTRYNKSTAHMSQFVHLHLHTDYSMLDGACDVEKLVDRVKQLGMPAVAMTDHGNIFGAVHFVNAAHKAGVKPIVGCELYIC